MTDSMDKKLKEKRDNLDVDLDAMLDKAESSFLPANESQDENDDLDRLLIDSDFDADDQSMQADTAIERNTYPDELDDFLSFDNFDDDVGEAQNTPPVDNLFSSAQTNENAYEEDDLDRLLMNTALDSDNRTPQVEEENEDDLLEELDDFSNFSDFNAPELTPTEDAEQSELPAESLFAHINSALAGAIADDLGPDETLSEANWLQNDAAEIEQPVELEDELDDFSDFSDFNEPDAAIDDTSWLQDEEAATEIEEPIAAETAAADELDAAIDEALAELMPAAEIEQPIAIEDEPDEFSDFSDFNEPDAAVDDSDWLQDEETVAEIEEPIAAETAAADELDAAIDEALAELTPATEIEHSIAIEDELDDFSDVSDFNEPDAAVDDSEWLQDEEAVAEIEEPIAAETAAADELDAAVDDLNWLQDDEEPIAAETAAADKLDAAIDEALAELTPVAEIDEPIATEAAPVDAPDAAIDDANWLQEEDAVSEFEQPIAAETAAADELDAAIDEALAELTPAAEIEQPVELEDELDEFSDFSDFNEPDAAVDDSDWLQDEDAISDFEQPIAAETAATDEPDTAIDEELAELTPAAEINEPIATETAPVEEMDAAVDDLNWLQDDEVIAEIEEPIATAATPVEEIDAAVDDDTSWLQDEEAVVDFEQPIAAKTAPTEQLDAAFDDTSWLQDEETVADFEQPIAAAAAPAEQLDAAIDDTSWLQDEEAVADFEQPIAAAAAPAEQLDAAVDDTSWLQDEEAVADFEQPIAAAAAPAEQLDAAVDDTSWLQDEEAVADFEQPIAAAATPADEIDAAVDDTSWLQEEDAVSEFEQPIAAETAAADKLDATIDEALAELTPAAEIDEPIATEAAPVEEMDAAVDDLNWLQDDEAIAEIEEAAAKPVEEIDAAVDETSWLQDEEAVADFEQPIAAETTLTEQLDAAIDDADWLQDDEELTPPAKESIALDDELDDFSGLDGGFDVSNLIQDDETELATQNPADSLQDDEDSFNSLFADSDFNDGDTVEPTDTNNAVSGDDVDLSEIDDFFKLDEVSDDFSKQLLEAEALASAEQAQDDEDNQDDFLLPDFDITADNETMGTDDDSPIPEDEFADAFGDTSFLDKAETEQPTQQESSENKTVAADTVAMENIVNVRLSPFEFEQEEIKKQLEVTEKKLKKAKIFSYVALGFGAVALTAAIGLGVMTYKAKTEVSSLTGVVTNLELSLKNSAEGDSKEAINTMLSSVVQLNQQIYDFINDLKGNPQLPADTLNSKVPGIAEKQVMVSNALKTLRGKIGDLDEATLSELSIVESPKEPTKIEIQPTPAKESHNTLMPPVKTEAVIEPIASPKIVVPEPPPIAVKEPPKVEVAAKVKIKAEVVKPKPVISAKIADRELSKPSASGNWGVNLVAFKQEWFAQSKAAEFARQGVYAEVIPIQGDGGTMYRLRVGGFASKKEANASKDKIRRVLNLDSVWVSDN